MTKLIFYSWLGLCVILGGMSLSGAEPLQVQQQREEEKKAYYHDEWQKRQESSRESQSAQPTTSDFDRGLRAYDSGDYATAVASFTRAAQGDAAAQLLRG